MAEKMPDSVGSFLGLITCQGKLRLQMRTEKGSHITGISYKGDFELTGGAAKEKDLRKILTPKGLVREAIREAKEELGIVIPEFDFHDFYRAIFENFNTGKVDWAFMIPVGPSFWDETAAMKRKTVDVDPDQLNVLGELNLIVSGKKRMWRMGQAAIYMLSNHEWQDRASELLTEVRPDWRETEYFKFGSMDLYRIRRNIGLK